MKMSTSALAMQVVWLVLAFIAFVNGREEWGFFDLGVSSLMYATHLICKSIEKTYTG